MSRPRLAILILAHRLDGLRCLAGLLDDRFRLFVHLDAKTARPAESFRLPRHASWVEPARPVFWGGWSMMAATLDLIRAARAAGGFDRYALVSGDSLPVVPLDTLAAALGPGAPDRVDLVEVPDDPSLAGAPPAEAIARHGWVQPWRFQNARHWDDLLLNPFTREAVAERYGIGQDAADFLRGDVARLVADLLADLHPTRPRLFRRFFYGAQWWALSGSTIEAILPALLDVDVQRYFRHLEVPDEHMIQTVLGDRNVTQARPGPMFTDHVRRAAGDPTIDGPGIRAASRAGFLFARKFVPSAAPSVAAALASGRYERDVLGGPPA